MRLCSFSLLISSKVKNLRSSKHGQENGLGTAFPNSLFHTHTKLLNTFPN
jgi:hypothetical protein